MCSDALTNGLVRRATLADIEAMSFVRLAVKENALSNPARITHQMYEDYLDRLGRGWVCEWGGRVVGFSYAERADHSIWALFVSPAYEGRGIGKALLQCTVDWLFEVGAAEVQLSTQADTRADRFYLAQGWRRGEMKNAVEVRYTLSRKD